MRKLRDHLQNLPRTWLRPERRWALLSVAVFGIVACVTMSKDFTRILDVTRTSKRRSSTLELSSAKDSLTRLAAAIDKLNAQATDFVDVRAILQAMNLEFEAQNTQALSQWRFAMLSSKGLVGEQAFLGWLRLWAKSKPQRREKLELAKAVLTDTQQLAISPWAVQRGLNQEQSLAAYLEKNLPEYVIGDTNRSNVADGPNVTLGKST